MNKQKKSVSIRFPLDLLAELQEVANGNNRSLNGEVITVLSAHVKREKKRQAKERQDA